MTKELKEKSHLVSLTLQLVKINTKVMAGKMSCDKMRKYLYLSYKRRSMKCSRR